MIVVPREQRIDSSVFVICIHKVCSHSVCGSFNSVFFFNYLTKVGYRNRFKMLVSGRSAE